MKISKSLETYLDSLPVIELGDYIGPTVARGPEEHKELLAKILSKGGRPRVDNPKKVISIRLEDSEIQKLKSHGRGWQSKLRNYISTGIHAGLI